MSRCNGAIYMVDYGEEIFPKGKHQIQLLIMLKSKLGEEEKI
jgi:hypothetical protein